MKHLNKLCRRITPKPLRPKQITMLKIVLYYHRFFRVYVIYTNPSFFLKLFYHCSITYFIIMFMYTYIMIIVDLIAMEINNKYNKLE